MKKYFAITFLSILPFYLSAQGVKNQAKIQPYQVGIIVTDLEKATDWYQEIFDVELKHQFSFPEYYSMRVNILANESLRFELVGRESFYRPEELIEGYDIQKKPIRGYYKISFEVSDIEDFYEYLKAKGVDIYFELATDQELGIKAFNIKDMDGNFLQFAERI